MSCVLMHTVTYGYNKVRSELEHWVHVDIDVAKQKELAALFGVKGIPLAIAVNENGKVLGRVLGFKAPKAFLKDIEAYRRVPR